MLDPGFLRAQAFGRVDLDLPSARHHHDRPNRVREYTWQGDVSSVSSCQFVECFQVRNTA